MSYDPSEFGSIDEHIPADYEDYLDEMHPPLTDEELNELEAMECDYIFVDSNRDSFNELDF
jgi:hypothetical protein